MKMEGIRGLAELRADFCTVVFLVILICGVWQDMRYRSVSRSYLILSGAAGSLLYAASGYGWGRLFLSAAVGLLLLGVSVLTDGGIGEGDGWFFVVTGFFLEPAENMILFLSGVIFCSVYSLTLAAAAFAGGGSIRRKRLPFLPYLLPIGLWLAFS